MTFLPFLLTVLAFAGPSRLTDPRAAFKQNLALLERKCTAVPKLAERVPKACEGQYSAAVETMAGACLRIHAVFEDAWLQAEALVLEAIAWRAKKSMVKDEGGHVSISLSLSSDPTYPFHKGDQLTNDALTASSAAISNGAEPIRRLEKEKNCRAAKRETAVLWREWEGERVGENIVDFHNALGMGLSAFLLQAQRSLEAGAHDDAVRGLQNELKRK